MMAIHKAQSWFVRFTDWLENSETSRRWLVIARYLPVLLSLIVIPFALMDVIPRIQRNHFQGATIVFTDLPWPTTTDAGRPKTVFRPGEAVYVHVKYRTTAYGTARSQLRLESQDGSFYQVVPFSTVYLAIGSTDDIARLAVIPDTLPGGMYRLRGHLEYDTSIRRYEAEWTTQLFEVRQH